MNTTPSRHSVSVSGVIPDDHGRVLLIRRRDNQHWEPPGGVLELAETIHDGLRREIREETGLDIEPGAITGIYKNMPRGIIALVFRCKITGGQLTANNEVTAFRWADEAAIRAAGRVRPDLAARGLAGGGVDFEATRAHVEFPLEP